MKPSRGHQFESPRLPEQLPGLSVTTISEDAEFCRALIADGDLSNQSAQSVAFDQVGLQRVLFSQSRLPGIRLTDVHIEFCDLSGATWDKARWRRVRIDGSRLIGLQLRELQGIDVQMHECSLEGAIITASLLKSARFVKCNLRRALLEANDLCGATFRGCDLTDVDFTGSKMKGADLRGSNLEGIRVSSAQLQGIIIDPLQALSIVGLLGITVKDIGEDSLDV